MSKIVKICKDEVKAEELEKLGRTVEEINELVEVIVDYCKTCGTINYITASVREGRIYVNINTKFNLSALAYSLSERTGLKYRTNKNYGSIALLLWGDDLDDWYFNSKL